MNIYLDIFLTFMRIGAFTFGGGYAMIPLFFQEIVVHHGWLTQHEMVDIITISQMTPGPIAINAATLTGYQAIDVSGAALATISVVLPAGVLLWVVARYWWGKHDTPRVQAVFRGIRPAVVALIAAAGITLGRSTFTNWWSVLLLAVALVAAFRRVHPVIIILACGAVGMLVYI